MTNTIQRPAAQVLLAGKTEPRIVQPTNIGADTTFFNTSSTWSVVNAIFNTPSGWFAAVGQESTPTNNIFTSYKVNGYTMNRYNVNNQVTSQPIAGFCHTYSTTSKTLGNNFIATDNGAIYRNLSIFTSTGWTAAVAAGSIYAAGFFNRQNDQDRLLVGGQITYAYGKNASGQGVLYAQSIASSSTMAIQSTYTRTDGAFYTAGTYAFGNTIVLGTSTGHIVSLSGPTLLSWGNSVPGTGPITALAFYNGRLFATRGTAGGSVSYSTSNFGAWTTVTPTDTANGVIGACMDTSTYGNYTAEFHYDLRYGAILMTGSNCSLWYSTDNGNTWIRNTTLTPTLLGNTAFGYVRIVYNNGYDEYSGVVAGRADGNRTGSLLRNKFWFTKPIN